MACQEAVLLSATKEEKANAAKSDFLRKLSYDIRTPINGIRELVELGNRYDHDLEKQRECRKKIWETSDVLLDLRHGGYGQVGVWRCGFGTEIF